MSILPKHPTEISYPSIIRINVLERSTMNLTSTDENRGSNDDKPLLSNDVVIIHSRYSRSMKVRAILTFDLRRMS